MAHFFSMYISSSSAVGLHGTITVTDGCGDQPMFNRSIEDCEYKQPGSTSLLLIGPPQYVSGLDAITVHVNLKDKDSGDEIEGWFSFLFSSLLQQPLLDHPLCEVFEGKNGSSLRMYYSVFSHAVEATVKVLLTKAPDSAAVMVDGQITAQDSFIARKNNLKEYQTVLKERGCLPVVVSPGEFIPLSRHMVVVPCESILMVSASLRDEYGNQIARGVAKFSPKMLGDSVEMIPGRHGEILVTLTWRDF